MSYLNLNQNDRCLVRLNLKKFNIPYKYTLTKVTRIDGLSFNRKIADVNEGHMKKILEELKNQSTKKVDGTCRIIANKSSYKNFQKIYKRFKGEESYADS